MNRNPAPVQPVNAWTPAIVVVWGVFVAIGFAAATRFEFHPNGSASAPSTIPTELTSLPVVSDPAPAPCRIFLAAHPLCPCTEATLLELETAIQEARRRGWIPDVTILFTIPSNPSPDEAWTTSTSIRRARSMPNVHVILDTDGRIADRLGARTSGDIIAFNAAGELAFHGGITLSRGNTGDNPGRQAIISIATGAAPDVCSTPVFGCELVTPDDSIADARDHP